MGFTPRHRGFENRLRHAFSGHPAMRTIAAHLLRVLPGEVSIEVPYRASLAQPGEALRAGVVAAALEAACSYAGFTLMPVDAEALAVEFKLDMLAPARGERLFVLGRVLRETCTACVCEAAGYMRSAGTEKRVAQMTATVMLLRETSELDVPSQEDGCPQEYRAVPTDDPGWDRSG